MSSGLRGFAGRVQALADAGQLLLPEEGFERWKVLAGGGAGGHEELLGHVEERRGAGALAICSDLGEQAAVDQVAHDGV
jgi:hypothetical protein